MNPLFLIGIGAAIARLKRKCPHCGKIQTVPRRIRGSVACKFCGQAVPADRRSRPHQDRMAFSR